MSPPRPAGPVMIADVAQAYGLRPARATVVGAPDRRVRVRIDDEAGRSHLVRSRPPWIRRPDFATGLTLQEAASAHGAPISGVLRTRDGEVVHHWHSLDLAVHRWAEGRILGWSTADADALGGATARFSATTAGLPVAQAGDWSYPAGRARWFPDGPHDLRASLRFLDELRLTPNVVGPLVEILDRAEEDAEVADLPTSFLHGDVHPLNAVRTVDSTVLVDLDEMRWGHRLFDAAQGVAVVAGLDPGTAGPLVRRRWHRGRADAFLSAWADVAEPAPAEVATFPALLRLVLLKVVVGELDLDDPDLPTRPGAEEDIASMLHLLLAPPPTLVQP